jgi:hypothetical protein
MLAGIGDFIGCAYPRAAVLLARLAKHCPGLGK